MSRDLWPSRAAREFTDDAASYDLVALNSSAGDPVWVARGKSQDLRKLLPADLIDNILPKLREAATYNDKLVAVPQYWNTEMYFYRKDLFADPKNQADFKAKYGYDLAPPTTWDQLADIDEFFYRPPDLYGGWMSGVNWGIGLDYQTILFGVGGRAFDLESNALLANSPESVKTFEIMQRIAKTAPESFATQSFFDADTLMLGGKLASYTNYSYIWAALAKQPDKYGMTVLPGKGIPIGTFFFAVPESAPNVACAVKFMTWMLSDDYQAKQVAETGNPPATITQMANPEVTKPDPGVRAVRRRRRKADAGRSDLGAGILRGRFDCRRRRLCRQEDPAGSGGLAAEHQVQRTGNRSSRILMETPALGNRARETLPVRPNLKTTLCSRTPRCWIGHAPSAPR